MKQIYLDYSATTPVKKEVLDEMLPFFTQEFGNPSSLYTLGQNSKSALIKARENLAALIGADSSEVFFTSSGTEADNWALIGTAEALKDKGRHIITTKIEHHANIRTCEYLETKGYDITYLDVQPNGIIEKEALKEAIRSDTILISVMMINNEIGTMQPIKELAAIAKEHNITVHTDAVQGLGNVSIDVKELGVDLMSVSAHKIYGPKGIGALYIKSGTAISSFMHGGAQEKNRRAGTENVTGIVGFGKAAELAKNNIDAHIKRTTELRDYFIDQVVSNIPDVILNGDRVLRHPGNANFTFKYIEGESILVMLDLEGISASTGSACSSGSNMPSHVITALKIPPEYMHSTIRFTIGDFTSKEDIDYTVGKLSAIVKTLRDASPISK
jgi:cysteine desulfurase